MGPGFEDPARWRIEALWAALEPLLPGLAIELLPEAPSTNTLLMERARQHLLQGQPHEIQPGLMVALHQTGGRGRMGRAWQSSPGATLTASLAMTLAPRDWSGLSLLAGVVLAQALDEPCARIGLKWPNDLWLMDGPWAPGPAAISPQSPVDGAGGRPLKIPGGEGTVAGRKLAGILIETMSVDARSRHVVLGFGINVRPLPEGMDKGQLASGYACMQELEPQIQAADVLHRVALPLVRAMRQFEGRGGDAAGGAAAWRQAYAQRDVLSGHRVRVMPGLQAASADLAVTTPLLEGMALGVNDAGELLLRDAQGMEHRVSSGEVSVRLWPGD